MRLWRRRRCSRPGIRGRIERLKTDIKRRVITGAIAKGVLAGVVAALVMGILK